MTDIGGGSIYYEEDVTGAGAFAYYVDSSSGDVSSTTVSPDGNTIDSGGIQYVYADAAAGNTGINAGGAQYVVGGTSISATLAGVETAGEYGFEGVSAGGVSSNTAIYSGGDERVFSGSLAVSTIVNSTGYGLTEGGLALYGGTAIGTTILGGGQEGVFSGGTDVSATLTGIDRTGGYGFQAVETGGVTSRTVISSGGAEKVYAGGLALSTIVDSTGVGATEGGLALSGGIASDTTINSGGQEGVFSGGTDVSATVSNGGALVVFSGGLALNTTYESGGQVLLEPGGTGEVDSGFVGSGAFISTGATGIAAAGGTEIGGTNDGGKVFDLSGGVNSGGTIISGGTSIVSAGGLSVSATIGNGGTGEVLAGGTASGATVGSGGTAIVNAGAIASATTLDGGSVVVSNGGGLGSEITFAGAGGNLQIDGTTMPTTTISGFANGDTIDLAGVAFASGATAALGDNNELSISVGGNSYHLQFDPTQTFSGGVFDVASDGKGGTEVALVSSKQINQQLDFSTTNQSIWESGKATTVAKSLSLFNETVSSGAQSLSTSFGTLSVASASAGVSLSAQLQGTVGDLSLSNYDINADITVPDAINPGETFEIGTGVGAGTGVLPTLTTNFPAFTFSLDANVSAQVSKATIGLFSLGSPSISKSVSLLSFNTSSQSKTISAAGVSLTLSAPKSFNTDQTLGTGTLPSVTLDTSSTNQLISATGDVLDLVPTTLPLSKSVTVPGFGKLSYTLAEADLTAGLQLAQQFVLQPTAIDVTVKFGNKEETGALGSSFTFTAPTSLKGSAPLSVTYSLVGNLESEIGYVGNVTLTVNALSGQVGSASFGPLASTGSLPLFGTDPVYLTNNTFALTGFNTVSDNYSIPVAAAAAAAHLKLSQAVASFGASTSVTPLSAPDPSKEHAAQNMLAASAVHSG